MQAATLSTPLPLEPTPASVTVILPAFNEAAALGRVLTDVRRVLGAESEIIVVDDGSTDETAAVASEFPCRLIQHDLNRGKGAAVRTGLADARGEYVVIMDADGTYPASAIPRMVDLLARNHMVRGVRRGGSEHMPFINRLGNRLFDSLLRGMHGLDGRDHLSGMYGFRREVVLDMSLEAKGFDIEAEIAIKARAGGLRSATFPINYQPRLGDTKLRPWRDGIQILGRILALILIYNPMLTFVIPGLVVTLLAVAGALILRERPLITPYFGLSIHSFIVATLGILTGFQLMVFGLAAALYRLEVGYQPAAWLVRLASAPVRLGMGGLGLLLVLAAGFRITQLAVDWYAGGAGIFLETRPVVLASTALVWGLQILSAALFLSIFAGRLKR